MASMLAIHEEDLGVRTLIYAYAFATEDTGYSTMGRPGLFIVRSDG
jgi:hypothetical protein